LMPGTLPARAFGKGRVYETPQPAANPAADGSIPQYSDYALASTAMAQGGHSPDFFSGDAFRFIHRRDGDTDIYFVSNPSGEAVKASCSFRTAGKKASLWDPVSGRISPAPAVVDDHGQSLMDLTLEAHGSIFVVFQPASSASRPDESGIAPTLRPGGGIEGPWRVRFTPGRGAPESIVLPALVDLAAHADEGIRHFSGTVVYSTAFEAPAARGRVVLDLGRVEVMARVKLNGRDLGILWHAPFRLELGDALLPGMNKLEIEVANLWLNRLIGDASLPPERRLAPTTWNPYKPDSPLPPSGLIGPVRLLEPVGR
jgi:hypothetical protein